jgi:intracellular septation protein
MVSTISQGEVWCPADQRPARRQLRCPFSRNNISREQDDEGRIRQTGADFFSTILFIAIYLATDNVLLATGVAIAGAVAQVIYSRIKGKELGYMTWASLALVIVLGSATLLTHDPRFVLAKPAIGHFAIGVIMLKRGWMLRYLPPIVTETIPEYAIFAGYAWAALCFVLAAGTIGVAMTGDMKLWTFYVTVVLVGAKIAAFAIQYIAFRILVGSRLRAAARA